MHGRRKYLLIIGNICAMYIGTVFPLFSLFISKLIVLLSALKYGDVNNR